MGSFLLLP